MRSMYVCLSFDRVSGKIELLKVNLKNKMFNGIKQFGSQGAALAKLAILQKKIQGNKTVVEEGNIKAVVTGDGKLKELHIDGENMNNAVKVINEAITKAQKYAAEEMKDSMGDLSKVLGNLPKGA